MSGYSEGGASLNKKSLKSWRPAHYSAKTDIDANLSTLRSRAADLSKNDSVAAAIIATLVTGVIGSGLKPFPRIKADEVGLTPEEAQRYSRLIKREFELWAKESDYLRRQTFYEQQQTAFRSMLTEGDCFCLFKRRLEEPYSLRLQLVEALRVSNPLRGDVVGTQVEMIYKGNRIINGLEVDASGMLVAIWISNKIWNEPNLLQPDLNWQRVLWRGQSGTRNVLHICREIVVDQFRGVPVLAPAVESLKQLSRYSDAELSSSIIRSFFSIFFVQPETNWSLNQITGDDYDAKDFKLGSPSVSSLPRGVDVKSIDSARQQSTFADFTNAFLKTICAAVNLPAEIVLKSFNASYSASRAAMLQAENSFKEYRDAFITDFCAPIYEQFLTEAIARGRIEAQGFFESPLTKAAWLKCDWRREQNLILDPTKEVNAAIMRLNAGLSTYKREVAQLNGDDFDDVVETLRQEKALLKGVIDDDSDKKSD